MVGDVDRLIRAGSELEAVASAMRQEPGMSEHIAATDPLLCDRYIGAVSDWYKAVSIVRANAANAKAPCQLTGHFSACIRQWAFERAQQIIGTTAMTEDVIESADAILAWVTKRNTNV